MADEKKKIQEPWYEWEKTLKEEGFEYYPDKGAYLNFELSLGWTKETVLEEFEDIADFREWIWSYRSDPERQEAVKKVKEQYEAGKGASTNTLQ